MLLALWVDANSIDMMLDLAAGATSCLSTDVLRFDNFLGELVYAAVPQFGQPEHRAALNLAGRRYTLVG